MTRHTKRLNYFDFSEDDSDTSSASSNSSSDNESESYIFNNSAGHVEGGDDHDYESEDPDSQVESKEVEKADPDDISAEILAHQRYNAPPVEPTRHKCLDRSAIEKFKRLV